MRTPRCAEAPALLRALRRAGRARRATARRAARRASAAAAARRSRSPRSSPRATSSPASTRSSGCLAHGGMGWVYLAQGPQRLRPLGRAQGPARTPATTTRWPPRSPSGASWPRSSTRTSSRSSTSSSTSSSGYIVMEYVGGTSLTASCGPTQGATAGRPAPLPAAQAIAYMLEILPALGHLHGRGLLFCDFKLDNVIQTQHSLKLIDLGGVYRIDDAVEPDLRDGRLPGAGDRAGRARRSRPTSTRSARTLAVLCFDFQGYQGHVPVTLPPPDSGAAASQRFDSLLPLPAQGAPRRDPDDRFQSADEMADQLFGRPARGRRAPRTGTTVPGAEHAASRGDFRARPDASRLARAARAARRHRRPGGRLSSPRSPATDPAELVELLRAAPDRTVEVELRLARALIDAGDLAAADALLERSRRTTRGSGGPQWYARRGAARAGPAAGARGRSSTPSIARVPGELAPEARARRRRGGGGAARRARRGGTRSSRARTRAFTTASFGLARCRAGAAATAPGRWRPTTAVPATSSAYADAQLARIRLPRSPTRPAGLGRRRCARPPPRCEALTLDAEPRAGLTVRACCAPRSDARARRTPAGRPATTLLGVALAERDLRARAGARLPDARARMPTTATSASGSSTAPTPSARGPGRERDVACAARPAQPRCCADDRFCEACGARRRQPRAGVTAAARGTRRSDGYCTVCGAASRAAASSSTWRRRGGQRAGRAHRRNEDAYELERVRRRRRRGRLRRHLASTVGRCRGARRGRRRGAPCSPRPCATAPTLRARRRTAPPRRARAPSSRVPATEPSPTSRCRRARSSRAACRDGEIMVGWIGDSRAYWLAAGDARQLTVDDSWAARAGRGRPARPRARPCRDPPRARHHALGRRRRARRRRRRSSSTAAAPRAASCCARTGCGTTRPAADLRAGCSRRCPPRPRPSRSRAPWPTPPWLAAAHDNITVAVIDIRPRGGPNHDALRRRDLPERVPAGRGNRGQRGRHRHGVGDCRVGAAPAGAAEIVIVDTSGSMVYAAGKIERRQAGDRGGDRLHPRRRAVRRHRRHHAAPSRSIPRRPGWPSRRRRRASDARERSRSCGQRRHRDRHVAARWPRELFSTAPEAIRHAILLTDGQNEGESRAARRGARAVRGALPVRLPGGRDGLGGRRAAAHRLGPARDGRHHPRARATWPPTSPP